MITLLIIIIGFIAGIEIARPVTKNHKLVFLSGIIWVIICLVIFPH